MCRAGKVATLCSTNNFFVEFTDAVFLHVYIFNYIIMRFTAFGGLI